MFTDSNAEDRECVNCISNWKVKKTVGENGCQTDENSAFDQESQVAFYQDNETQTEKKKSASNSDSIKNPMADPKFYKFIAKAVPMLEAELEAAFRSRAFDGYELLEAESESQVRKLHTLDATATRTRDEGLKVSSIAWSTAGSVIAVAYEAEEHENWCDHPSALHIWNINRRDFDPGVAYKVLPASACITSVQFHPVESGLVAAGGYSGEIHVWNVLKDSDPLVASSGVGAVHGHRDRVSTVNWIAASHLDSRASRNNYYVLSTGLDGIMILWSIDQAKDDLIPIKKFLVETRHLPKVSARKKTDVGITCISMNTADHTLVIFGTESGAILEGSLTTPNIIHAPSLENLRDDNDKLEWHDPVKITFNGHKGRVGALAFSPFERNLFLSSGSDQQIRIYSLLHPYAPVHVIPLEETSASSLAWSLSRPLIFAAGCQNNRLLIFDLRLAKDVAKATTMPLELKASEKLIPFPLTTIAFNGKDQSLIGTGDGFGRVHVWKLTPALISKNPDENKILANLGHVQDD